MSRSIAVLSAMILACLAACAPASGTPPPASGAAGAGPPVTAPVPAPSGATPSAVAPSNPALQALPALPALIDGARREGQLVIVSTAMGEPDAIRRWTDGFNKLYGLNVQVQHTPGQSFPQVAAKLTEEYQAGRRASTDVYLGSDYYIEVLLQAGVLEPVDWATWAPNVRDGRMLAPQGVAVKALARIPGITYNSNKVRPEEVPTSLQDLLKPQYKGRVATTPSGIGFDLLATSEMWGVQRTLEFARAFADQTSGLITCAQIERVASGEFDVFAMDCTGATARGMREKGAPVDQVIPADAAIMSYTYLGVPKNAAHPNAAKLWINYLLSREGQDIMFEYDFLDLPLVEGSKIGRDVQQLQARGVRFTEVDVEFYRRNETQELTAIRDELTRILRNQ